MTQSIQPKNLLLYADDDPDDVKLIKEALHKHTINTHLVTFSNGLELIEYIKRLLPHEVEPCLIIIDINMPVLNGKEALKQTREIKQFEHVPIVLFSTSTLPSEAVFADCFNAGYITKPIHEKQIDKIIQELIQHCSEEVKRKIYRHRRL